MNQWTNLDTEETLLQAKREEQEKKMKQLDACRSDYQNHFKKITQKLDEISFEKRKILLEDQNT
ncbi:hypothetical protein [Enterococcus mundtii]|uniref:hypothetical protein n=1 Tax=Enterococcus mundtii TaxID=53346 RepID=UPI00115C08BA|nr:hypothetical protein [Enterococcus mundtii]